MSKDNSVKIQGYDFFAWKYKDHTKTKHQVLKCYLEKWYPILGKSNALNYFDCFGGCGVYTEDGKTFEPGSPIIAALAWINKGNKGNPFCLCCIESNKQTLENLKKAFSHYCPDMIEPLYIQDDFDNSINSILDEFERDNKSLAPSFFFIDPFGISIKYSTIKRIMEIDKSEILLNFMYDSVQRWLTHSELEDCLSILFGCDSWKAIQSIPADQKEVSIIRLFRKQLKKVAQFVMPYRVCYPDKDRTFYYLVHLTNNQLGAIIMKSCFAEINYGSVEYLGKQKHQTTFLDAQNYKQADIKSHLLECFSQRIVTYDELIAELIDTTPYLEKEIKDALYCLRDEGRIVKGQVTSKREKAILGKDTISFVK